MSEGFEARCLLHEIDHLDGILSSIASTSLSRDVFGAETSALPADRRHETRIERRSAHR